MKRPSTLSNEIRRMEEAIADTDGDSKEYYRLLVHLEKLYEIRDKNEKKFKFDVDSNTLVTAGSSLLGILLILQHERLHAVASKALGFITKLKF